MIKFGTLSKDELKKFNQTIDEDKNKKDIRLGDMEPHEVQEFLYVNKEETKDE